jgi:hypothetical protein
METRGGFEENVTIARWKIEFLEWKWKLEFMQIPFVEEK